MQTHPASLHRLCHVISKLSNDYQIIVIPGGGVFADTVERMQKKFQFSDLSAHRMALLGMNQYGHMLAELMGSSAIISDRIDQVGMLLKKGSCVIMQVYDRFSHDESVEASWKVTSDTLACLIAGEVQAMGLVLLKDVDGLYDPGNPRSIISRVSTAGLVKRRIRGVDEAFPNCIKKNGLTAHVMNGRWPSRLEKILKGKAARGTTITP
jgi:aspartokinase-like uncharacterized kinase